MRNDKELADKILMVTNLEVTEIQRIEKELRDIVVRNHSVEGLMGKFVGELRK